MKRWAAFVGVAGCLLLGGLVLGSRGARADEEGGEKKIERTIKIVHGGSGAFLGVGLEDLEGADRGAKVASVEPDSAADKAGVQDGDVITRFDGVDVRSASQLSRLVRETPAGREVQIDVRRGGTTTTLTATLGERRHQIHVGEGGVFVPDFDAEDFDVEIDPAMPFPPGGPHPPVAAMPHVFRWHGDEDNDFTMSFHQGPPRLGVSVMDIEGQLAEYFGLEAEEGALVSSVKKDSPAAKAGIEAGDVVLEFGGQAIHSARDLRRQVGRSKSGTVTVKLLRDEKPLEVQVTLPEPEAPRTIRHSSGVSL